MYNISLPFEKDAVLRALLERNSDSPIILVNNKARIVYVSRRALELLGKKPDRLYDQAFFDAIKLTVKNGQELISEHPLKKVLYEGFIQTVPYFCQYRLEQDNKEFTCALLATAIAGDSHKPVGAVVTLRRAERQVEMSEMKNLFVSFAAHQLKTPSSIVRGFLELLIREGKQKYSDNQWQNLVSAYESNEQLIEVSKTLLNLARLEGGLVAPFIKEFEPLLTIRSKARMHEPLARAKNVKIEVVANEVGILSSDEQLIAEIFEVLLSNALRFTGDGTLITVIVEVTEMGLRIEVCDQGSGVPELIASKLFSAQVTSYGTSKNHGLGLRLARLYVALLKGDIGYKPNKEKGSCFYFTIPHAH